MAAGIPVFARELPARTRAARGFVEEPKDYNKFMSHPRGNQFPTPVWELSNEVIASLRNKYVIGEEKTPEEVMSLLEKSLDNNLDSIGSKQGFTFKVPKAENKFMEYNATCGVSLLCCGDDDYITRSFTDGRTRSTTTRTAWVTQFLRANFDAGISLTKRDVMYQDKELFPDQRVSDAILTDLCSIHRCRMPALKVLPAQKGLILGNIVLKLKSGRELNCSEGMQIPNQISKIDDIFLIDGESPIQYVLVVEKYTMQHYLEQMNYHNTHNCIIVTGCGMPGLTTREFLHLLKKFTGLPFYGICDPDPSGAKIMATYAQGSIESAYDNFNIAVPSLRWIGVFISQMQSLEHRGRFIFKRFCDQDKKTMKSLLADNMQLSEGWLEKLNEMNEIGWKASFEDLKTIHISYFADEMLPRLIEENAAINE